MSSGTRRSLRWRLIAAVTAASTAVAALAAAAIWMAIAHAGALAFDQSARDHARAIRPRLEEIAWRHGRDADLPAEDILEDPETAGQLVVLRGRDGRLFACSRGRAALAGGLPEHPGPDGVLVDGELPGLGAMRWLVLDIVARPPPGARAEGRPPRQQDGPPPRADREPPPRPGRDEDRSGRAQAQMVLIRSTAPLRADLALRAWLLGAAALAVCAVMAGLVAVIVHRLLYPVRSLGDAIAARRPEDPGRVTVAGLPAELQPVEERLNQLLDRVRQVLDRERQTTAAIAHELRTPIAGMRAQLELALLRHQDAGQVVAACRQGLATLTLLQGLIDNLMMLTRLESGQVQPRREAVEIAEAAAAVWALHQESAAARRIAFDRRIEPAVAVAADGGMLRVLLGNLVANAVTYADEGSAVVFEAVEDGETVRIAIANEGTTIGPDEVERVFAPFWRADAVRTVERGHCGLGLALVQRLSGVLGGTVRVEVIGRRFIVHLSLPTG